MTLKRGSVKCSLQNTDLQCLYLQASLLWWPLAHEHTPAVWTFNTLLIPETQKQTYTHDIKQIYGNTIQEPCHFPLLLDSHEVSDQQKQSDRESMAGQTHTHTCSPLRRCFFLVLRRMLLIPGTGFRSLLLIAGGCRIGLGARVKHTGSPAAHMRMPVIPDTNTHIYASAVDHGTIRPRSWVRFPGNAWTDKLSMQCKSLWIKSIC